MNLQENRAHVRKLLRRASKSDLVEACRRVSEYYQNCSRAGIPGDAWQHVLSDCLHVTITDRRHHTKSESGVSSHPGESRNYAGHYKRFYVAS
jgi:hypothetical protein